MAAKPKNIESPFMTDDPFVLTTNSVKLTKFANQLLEIAKKAGPDAKTGKCVRFTVGPIQIDCHPNGGN